MAASKSTTKSKTTTDEGKSKTGGKKSRTHRSHSSSKGRSAGAAAESALDHISELTGHEAVGVTAVQPNDDGWTVEVEVLEQSRIPSTSDILALFAADLDTDGNLLSYRRINRYSRGKGGVYQ